jgi:hypothetical protein
MIKKAILRDALIEELRLLINDTEGEVATPSKGRHQHAKVRQPSNASAHHPRHVVLGVKGSRKHPMGMFCSIDVFF